MKSVRDNLLRRFFTDAKRLSRNRNFHAFTDPRVRYAARVGKMMKSLRNDLVERELIALSIDRLGPGDPEAETFHFSIALAWDKGSRRFFLTDEELAVLLEDEDVRAILEPLAS